MKKGLLLVLWPVNALAQEVHPYPTATEQGKELVIFLIILSMVLLALCGYLIYRGWQQQKTIARQKNELLRQQLQVSQMNPHFIFNSLNAIQNYIFKNESLQAGTYLSQFSMLMRAILDSSKEEYAKLENEIKLLELYLELQQLRFEHKFDYHISVDPEIEPSEVKIPTVLAQPFIEYAIEHGIFYKKEKGRINIDFRVQNDRLVLEVEDDGIGPETPGQKNGARSQNRSQAMAMTQARIAGYNRQHKDQPIDLEIIDKAKEGKGETGMRVVFTLPYLLV